MNVLFVEFIQSEIETLDVWLIHSHTQRNLLFY